MSNAAVAPQRARAPASGDRPGRLHADEQLRLRLAQTGYAGPDYARFAGELAAYGLAICEAWLVTGLMFAQCRRHGRDAGAPPTDWSADDRCELALETVALALKGFRDRALIRGDWSVHHGASLRTYFVGSCILAFPNVYRAWRRERRHWGYTDLDEQAVSMLADTQPGPEDVVLSELGLRAELSNVDTRTAMALSLAAQGYSHEEIAEVVQTTARAVEALLYRHRRRSREARSRSTTRSSQRRRRHD
jgi:DNA-directed RNA polymerase specialized sigma24 family protein